ncbi:MAG: rhodanese-like domain-containing protein [Flavobacteriaceae bacterium]|nr:rhodanese-like domain-containing protein [Flavobacteriaceae bacterium]
MKELEKTKRISTAAVITLLVVIIALLAFKRPKIMYSQKVDDTVKTLKDNSFILSKDQLIGDYILVDIRSRFENNKGAIEQSVNIPLSELLTEESLEILEKDEEIVFYGKNPNEALPAHIILSQLGYQTKILSVELSYLKNELIVNPATVENTPNDINAFIQESVKKATEKPKPKPKPVVKQVIPKKKKKKMPVEGGC